MLRREPYNCQMAKERILFVPWCVFLGSVNEVVHCAAAKKQVIFSHVTTDGCVPNRMRENCFLEQVRGKIP